jgi:hypothetical protein
MLKIGQGFYYDVYDLGNGRVLKTQTGTMVRLRKLLKWYGKTWIKKIGVIISFPLKLPGAHRSLALSVATSTKHPELFGNPVFKEHFAYEQDKAIVLGDYFAAHSLDENKAMFDQYPKLLHRLWALGVSDTVFNFTINTGISLKTNELICIDFNEFTKSKEKVRECIRKRKWLTQASLRDMAPGPLKDSIIAKMAQEIIEEKLDASWPAT